MELRVLRYFAEVARLGNFTAAANALHVTQPTLSRQISALEEEIGAELFLRGKGGSVLTEAGRHLLDRAGEILELAGRLKSDLKSPQEGISGDVYIAGGETKAMRLLARAIRKARADNPGIRFHIYSGNAEAVAERLDKGLADLGVFIRPANLENYACINFPITDVWGLLLQKSDPLAMRESIGPEDLKGVPLLCSRQHMVDNELAGWLGDSGVKPEIAGTYTLLYNAAIMVAEGIGAAVCLDGIADTSSASELCFRPFKPLLRVSMDVAWKKDRLFSGAAAEFLRILKNEYNS